MNVGTEIIIKQRDIYGALFENMIIVDIMKNLNAQESKYNLSFYRDTNQNEVDLIIEINGKIIPVEIKAAATMNNSFFNIAKWFKDEAKADDPVVIYGGQHDQVRTRGRAISWTNTIKIIS